ncbi:Os12g0406000, partial [Oryza sativa Japonica Group]
ANPYLSISPLSPCTRASACALRVLRRRRLFTPLATAAIAPLHPRHLGPPPSMCPVSALRVPLLPRADEPLSPPRRRWMGTRSSVTARGIGEQLSGSDELQRCRHLSLQS